MKLQILLTTVIFTCLFLYANPKPTDSTDINNFNLIAQADSMSPELYQQFYDELMTTGTTNFLGLRLAYTKNSAFSGFGINTAWKDSLYASIDSKRFNEGQKYLDSLLNKYFPIAQVQLWAEVFYEAQANQAMAAKHGSYYKELITGLLRSGDGYSAKTGYIVLDVSEEYELLKIWKLKFMGQALLHKDGQILDVITAINPQTQAQEKIYFNITILQKRTFEQLKME